jgi:hypothetical protein
LQGTAVEDLAGDLGDGTAAASSGALRRLECGYVADVERRPMITPTARSITTRRSKAYGS